MPYFDRIRTRSGDMEYLEYPVLTGVFMEVASWLTPHGGDLQHREQIYWMVNAGMLMICAAVIAVCVARTHRRRPWDGAAGRPGPRVRPHRHDQLGPAGRRPDRRRRCCMWSRSRPLAAGVLIGLATAAKLYPVLLLGPLLVLCWRAGPVARVRHGAGAARRRPGWW